MSEFEAETAVVASGTDRWTTELSTAWHIGDSANGGYASMPVLRALREVGGHPDPISVTTHFLRPVQDPGRAVVETELVRRGRTVSVARGTLVQGDRPRLVVTGAFGELIDDGVDVDAPAIERPAPAIPAPDACIDRTELAQGVDLPIAGRIDVRIHPDRARPGASDDAVMEGWIRLADGTAPSSLALTLFADAFPPTLYSRLGRVGWVPTIELTVHVRRRPRDGWIQARFECDDLVDGRMIETGTLWDAAGAVVARSRQLGLLLGG